MKTIKSNIYLVPAKEKTQIIKIMSKNRLVYAPIKRHSNYSEHIQVNQLLYFTTDEKIKKDNYCLHIPTKTVFKCNEIAEYDKGATLLCHDTYKGYEESDCRKIVASTDLKFTKGHIHQSARDRLLRIERIPQPTQQFIENYCKNPINECLIETELESACDCKMDYGCPFEYTDENSQGCCSKRFNDGNYYRDKIKVNSKNEITVHSIVDKIIEVYKVEDMFDYVDGKWSMKVLKNTTFKIMNDINLESITLKK